MTAHYIASYYSTSLTSTPSYPELEGEHRVDVAVIGGGFTGLATALELAEKGLKVAVVEAQHRQPIGRRCDEKTIAPVHGR